MLERLLLDRDVDDDTRGFHAQQAVEKLLEAAMAIRGLDYPRPHDLGALIDMLAKGGMTLPEELADVDLLTPFGTIFRYDEVVQQAGRDRQQWLGWIRSLRSRVTAMKR